MNAPINPAIAAAIAAAKANEDQTKIVKGGEGYKPPVAGVTFGRLVGYYELGKETYEYKGTPKTKDRVRLVFELIDAKKHPPIVFEHDGITTTTPVRITVNINKSFGENGGWRKLFTKLNYAKDITHAAEALGRAFKLTITHNTSKTDDKVVFANLTDETGAYLIAAPVIQVEDEDGNVVDKVRAVGPALTPLSCFLWDYCDKAQWDSIFIDGEFPAQTDDAGVITRPAKSKNVLQMAIKEATNFVGSPIHALLEANGDALEIPDAEHPTRPGNNDTHSPDDVTDVVSAANGDPLEGM